jgi:hypothetical protein
LGKETPKTYHPLKHANLVGGPDMGFNAQAATMLSIETWKVSGAMFQSHAPTLHEKPIHAPSMAHYTFFYFQIIATYFSPDSNLPLSSSLALPC